MKLSDFVADFIARQGVRHVFAISGGASLHLIHSVAEHPDIEFVCPLHEQAGAMAARQSNRRERRGVIVRHASAFGSLRRPATTNRDSMCAAPPEATGIGAGATIPSAPA